MNQITYQTLDAVKAAVVAGATVYWGNPAYVVKLSSQVTTTLSAQMGMLLLWAMTILEKIFTALLNFI